MRWSNLLQYYFIESNAIFCYFRGCRWIRLSRRWRCWEMCVNRRRESLWVMGKKTESWLNHIHRNVDLQAPEHIPAHQISLSHFKEKKTDTQESESLTDQFKNTKIVVVHIGHAFSCQNKTVVYSSILAIRSLKFIYHTRIMSVESNCGNKHDRHLERRCEERGVCGVSILPVVVMQ
jgi:hypothetical protein